MFIVFVMVIFCWLHAFKCFFKCPRKQKNFPKFHVFECFCSKFSGWNGIRYNWFFFLRFFVFLMNGGNCMQEKNIRDFFFAIQNKTFNEHLFHFFCDFMFVIFFFFPFLFINVFPWIFRVWLTWFKSCVNHKFKRSIVWNLIFTRSRDNPKQRNVREFCLINERFI